MSSLEKRVQSAIKAKTKRGGEWNKILEQEATLLYNMIKLEIVNYYASYTPVQYKRTFDMANSLRIKISGDSFHIYFEPSMAYHPNVMNKKKVFVPTLMDAGWYHSAQIHRFTYWEGDGFIERGIAHYRQRSNCPVKITIESKYYPEYYASIG